MTNWVVRFMFRGFLCQRLSPSISRPGTPTSSSRSDRYDTFLSLERRQPANAEWDTVDPILSLPLTSALRTSLTHPAPPLSNLGYYHLFILNRCSKNIQSVKEGIV